MLYFVKSIFDRFTYLKVIIRNPAVRYINDKDLLFIKLISDLINFVNHVTKICWFICIHLYFLVQQGTPSIRFWKFQKLLLQKKLKKLIENWPWNTILTKILTIQKQLKRLFSFLKSVYFYNIFIFIYRGNSPIMRGWIHFG